MKKILIADDESSIRMILSRAVEKLGHEPVCAENGKDAFDILTSQNITAALLDIRMPEMNGLDLLKNKDEFLSQPPLIIMTAQDTMENAVQAMKSGAYDYLTKPFDLEDVSLILNRAIESHDLKKEVEHLKNKSTTSAKIVGKSKAMLEVFKTIGKVADQDVTVLIQGESGTGKELIAKAIHEESQRREQSFIAVNSSAIPENLLESELFGYKKGAFTGAEQDKIGYFEQADGGTIFLDEIGDMPLHLQVKILRFLQEKTMTRLGETQAKKLDVRVIAATHQDLEKKIKAGEFREDLYFRLNVVPIFLPPLRERRNDIPALIDFFQNKYNTIGSSQKRFAQDALTYFYQLDWPGNVRELENTIKRCLVLAKGDVITKKDILEIQGQNVSNKTQINLQDKLSQDLELVLSSYLQALPTQDWQNLYEKSLNSFEKPLLNEVLKKTKGNQLKAAEILGINRNTLRTKLKNL